MRSSMLGSSPRVWGTPDLPAHLAAVPRFIPTGVGNTAARVYLSRRPSVHPHGCGEHASEPMEPISSSGSSPRVWGTPAALRVVILPPRFIPTGVGNTPASQTSPRTAAVHPHGCGEHCAAVLNTVRLNGSSPRVWGTHLHEVVHELQGRFIPTGVGNTRQKPPGAHRGAVHPHGCGEHGILVQNTVGHVGSSPRVWGTLAMRVARYCVMRFIPTGVGNTPACTSPRQTASVHPHGCGEHRYQLMNTRSKPGSSPRVWGTRQPLPQRCQGQRFIPTGVGNTQHG